MARQEQIRHVCDTQVALAVTLKRPDGTPVNLTGLTVKFKMFDSEGTEVVAATEDNVSVTDAAAGECQYTFQAADVDTEGSYYAYFLTVDEDEKVDTFPVARDHLTIVLQPGV